MRKLTHLGAARSADKLMEADILFFYLYVYPLPKLLSRSSIIV